jgi:mitosis inhibitor protein kinase SWE1
MVATFSPHRDAGGTLHLPSPTGMHHVDATSAIRQLRRSLSRSPSKSADFRLLSSRSHQQTPNTPFVSSPLSPSRRAHHGNLFFLPVTTSHLSTTTTTTATPVAIPFPPSAKINRPVMRRAGSFQNTRTRTSPKSPSKRALNISSDHGNATSVPPSLILSGDDDKNCSAKANDVRENVHLADHDLSSSELNLNLTPNHPPVTRVEKRRSGNFGPLSSTASPLKRSDGIMNLDQAGFESPSAKRRSLHGASFASEFNIFDTYDNSQSTTEASDTMARDTDTQTICIPNSPASPFATIPKRSSSLRRSTLQQRQGDRSFAGRSRLMNVDYSDSPPTSPGAVMRHRMSLDGSLSVASSRDNPFASQSPGTPTGTSLFSSVQNAGGATPHGAHPLSRTMTQSSSSSSLADDSPTHEPIHKGERPKAVFNFSKSLPAGATRPGAGRQLSREDSTSSSDSFATPENYKLVKPLPAAFLSTGLISKKSRNAEDLQNPLNTSKNMPDTPCKRSTNFLPTAQKALPVRPLERPKLTRQSFAVPSTPFNPQHTRPAPGPFARGTSIFGSAFNRPEPSRRGSFVSVDGDEQSLSQSPSTRHGTHSIIDTDLPPTPTKQTFPGNNAFSGSLGGASLDLPAEHQASNDNLEIASPRTPKDSFFPPDPSGLSISAPNEAPLTAEDFNSSIITFPATPTGPREFFASGAKRPSLALDNHNALDVDPSLTSRFERVELIGTGEFSQVYRVSSPQDASQYKSIFSLPSSGTNSPSTLPERVWAVKKSKKPFGGMKDRQRKLREVEILRSLVNSDHVISFVDHWEDKGHLYIQTEYCEEGSLDVFLAQAGLKARLDDFRIWKILLEMSQVSSPDSV